MGAVKSDLTARERALEESYPALNTAAGIKRLLAEINALVIRQYQGDYDAAVLLIDLENAKEKAKLTERQFEALQLIYEDDLTQEDAAKVLGVRQDAISRHIDAATSKIADIYEYWSVKDEGYTFEEPANLTEEEDGDE
jgi:DNA-directed RNA polymerase specialized sigma24 family protein